MIYAYSILENIDSSLFNWLGIITGKFKFMLDPNKNRLWKSMAGQNIGVNVMPPWSSSRHIRGFVIIPNGF